MQAFRRDDALYIVPFITNGVPDGNQRAPSCCFASVAAVLSG
jgi:hypothetical protein